MHHLLHQVLLIDPGGPHHLQRLDVRLRDGRLAELGENLPAAGAEVVDLPGACLSAGWVDVGAYLGDPGYEHREDFASLAAAAARGGYTHVAVLPEAAPVRHDKAAIAYIRRQSPAGPTAIHALGAVSRDLAGRELTEMIDMHHAGALAFTDGSHPIQHAGLLQRALLYVKAFGGLVLHQPLDESLAPGGQMHEGIQSTSLGLRGIPALAEELMVERDLRLLAYTESRLHLANLSTAGAVQRVRAAKAQGMAVTASVPALNLAFTDHSLADFDANLKVMPPLRGEADRQALLDGLADGTLDWVVSNHRPLEAEAKVLEFPYADFGSIGLETTFGLLRRETAGRLELSDLVDRLSTRSRAALGLPPVRLEVDAPADFTLFLPDQEWTVAPADLASKSQNTSLLGQTLRGRVVGVFYQQQLALHPRAWNGRGGAASQTPL